MPHTPSHQTGSARGTQTSGRNYTMEECRKNCQECAQVCLETVQYCLEKGGKHAEAEHLRLLLDCAEICQTSANFMTRGSDQHEAVCRACAEICEACAQSCETMADDAQMKKCAEACRRCADSCRQMSSAA